MDVYSEDEKLLRDILLDSAQYFPTPVDPELPMHMKNIHGDTPIHVAVSAGNMEAVKLLEGESKKILMCESKNEKTNIMLMKNKQGETPLFRAAACGQTENSQVFD